MEFNKKNMMRLFFLAVSIILVFLGLEHMNIVFGFLKWLLGVLTPFIIAGVFIFILNVPLKVIEKHLFRPKQGKPVSRLKEKARRPLAITLSITLFVVIIGVFLTIIIPEIGKSLAAIAENIPTVLQNLQDWVTDLSKKNDTIRQIVEGLSIDWKSLTDTAVNFVRDNGTNLASSAFGVISSLISTVVNVFLGIVLAVYVLMRKEKLSSDVKKLIYAVCPLRVADFLAEVGHLTNKSFYNSITGQMLECLIIGSLTGLGMTIFGFPYAALGGVVVAIMSWVPMFGIGIGTAIVALLLLTVNPMQALWFVVYMICLQQIEGNLIFPRVVGSRIGLPPIIMISAIILFSSFFGVIGLLVSGPVTYVIYTLVRRFVYLRIKQRLIPRKKYEARYDEQDEYEDEVEKLQQELDPELSKEVGREARRQEMKRRRVSFRVLDKLKTNLNKNDSRHEGDAEPLSETDEQAEKEAPAEAINCQTNDNPSDIIQKPEAENKETMPEQTKTDETVPLATTKNTPVTVTKNNAPTQRRRTVYQKSKKKK